MSAPFPSSISLGRRAALVVAHPGHELRIHGWLEHARPLTFVITDGSGGAGEGRIGSTLRLLERAGVPVSDVRGRVSDREIYALMLAGEHALFTDLVDEIADALVAADVDHVVTDAAEGFNPSHDVCRLIGAAAATRAARRLGRDVPHFDFLLVGRPDAQAPDALSLRLDDDALARKLAAARDYPELGHEIEGALAKFGLDAFRTEVLRPATEPDPTAPMADEPPYYETYGAQQVAAGRYAHVLRYASHFRPCAQAILEHGES